MNPYPMPGGHQGGRTGGPFGPGGQFMPAGSHSDLFWLHDLFFLIGLLIVVVAAVLIVRWLLRRPHLAAAGPMPPALTELDIRYARGEIERDDYLQRRADLINPMAAPTVAPQSVAGQTATSPPPAKK